MLKFIKKFRHSGDMGDIIYSLPVVKKNSGGIFLIDQNLQESEKRIKEILKPAFDFFFDWGEFGGMREWKFNFIKPLLESQKYIHKVDSHKEESLDVDLDLFRKDKGDNCVFYKYIHIFELPADTYDDKWLECGKKEIAETIVARSLRYNNYSFPWKKIVEKHKDIAFVGLDEEYDDFIQRFGHVSRYKTKDALELACVINGSQLFVGNQTLGYAIAEGLKKNTIQETCKRLPDCIFPRDNALYFINEKFTKVRYHDTQYS